MEPSGCDRCSSKSAHTPSHKALGPREPDTLSLWSGVGEGPPARPHLSLRKAHPPLLLKMLLRTPGWEGFPVSRPLRARQTHPLPLLQLAPGPPFQGLVFSRKGPGWGLHGPCTPCTQPRSLLFLRAAALGSHGGPSFPGTASPAQSSLPVPRAAAGVAAVPLGPPAWWQGDRPSQAPEEGGASIRPGHLFRRQTGEREAEGWGSRHGHTGPPGSRLC